MRAIDADALQLAIVEEGQANKRKKYIIGDIWELTGAEIREVINSQPTIQPEIVRCKDCKHWIPVEQALPEEPFGCLVTVWDEEPMTGEMFENLLPYFVGWDGEQWNDGDGQQCPFEVIAWMPLPEPYWEERTEE